MAVRAEFKVEGLQRLQERLMEKRDALIQYLDMRLMQLAEEAVTYSKENKGYKDRTANLKNSISFALYLDGQLVTMRKGTIVKTEGIDGDPIGGSMEAFASQQGVIAPKGYTLIVVAGMWYGVEVEKKGYNVLHLTKYFLHDEMRKILEEVIENLKSA